MLNIKFQSTSIKKREKKSFLFLFNKKIISSSFIRIRQIQAEKESFNKKKTKYRNLTFLLMEKVKKQQQQQ